MEPRSPGVRLDLGGTLVDSNYLHVLAWARAFDDHGFRTPMAEIHRMVASVRPCRSGTLRRSC